jgi:hypothetical protein
MREGLTKSLALVVAVAFASATTAWAQEGGAPVVESQPGIPEEGAAAKESAPAGERPDCYPVNKGGPIAGIVIASIFWWVLPMSIPVWITQAKKLKKRKREIYEQQQRGCPPQ